MKKATARSAFVLSVLLGVCLAGFAFGAPPGGVVSGEVVRIVEVEGHARVIVKLRTARPLLAESALSEAGAQGQRAEIARLQREVTTRVQGTASRPIRTFKSLPYMAMEVDKAGLARLASAGSSVEAVYVDHRLHPLLAESTYQIEADIAHESGITGAGSAIVVIDTGADSSHPFLSGKVVHEACFATNVSGARGACPNRKTSQVGNGAGQPCTFDPLSCYHGTHVSGIAVGSSSALSGVAPGATLIPIQVFHQEGLCSFLSSCAVASTSDVVAALEHVYDIRHDYPIAAVNMSLGGGLHSSACDAEYPLLADAISNLKAAGIATVAAAGNDGDPGGITAPACLSASVSVGAVDELDDVAHFSNGTFQVDLLAPGTGIVSSVPGGGFATSDGTSMATPHVAGAWAVLRQAYGVQDVDTELEFLKTTGQPVTDARGANIVVLPRVRLGPAAGVVNPAPVLSAVSPDPLPAGRDTTITVTGAGFVRSSVVIANGVAIPTTVLSDTELQAVLPKSMLGPTVKAVTIAVQSPLLGGGTSAALTVTVLQPAIGVSSTAAATGEVVTVTLSNGPGNQYDWMVLVPVDGTSKNWLKMTFVPAGQGSMNWNVPMPATAGRYEVRLLESGTYNILATSQTIVVGDPVEPSPGDGPPGIEVSATTASPGETLTVTLSNSPGNQYDWMVLVPVGGSSKDWLKMTFVPVGQASMTWNVAMPAASGNYEIRLLASGSYNVLATSPTIVVGDVGEPSPGDGPPGIEVSATTVAPGATVIATLSNSSGALYDWMVLVPVGGSSKAWLKMTFVPVGQTSMSWNVAMPVTPGNYEIRLLASGSYTVLATSPAIAVVQ